MNFEIIFLVLIFIFSLLVLFTDAKRSLYVLLGVSVLLHKELFSIYAWNLLPARVFMAALCLFVVARLFIAMRKKDYSWVKQSLGNPAGIFLLLFWVVAGVSMFFSKNIKASLSMYAFLTTVIALYFYLKITRGIITATDTGRTGNFFSMN